MQQPTEIDLLYVETLDKACLEAIRRFDQGQIAVEETLDVIEEYDQLITPDRRDTRPLLRATLEDAPWKSCPCDICREDGVDVIIFRGNNRNRRRGFHNVFVFYRLLQRVLAGEATDVNLRGKEAARHQQLALF